MDYLNYNMGSIGVRINELEWQKQGKSQTVSGYGAKLTTKYQVFYKNKWRRVYCCIYSNIGTLFIIVQGKKQLININN